MGKAETNLTNKMRKQAREVYGERLVLIKNHGTEFAKAGVSDLTGCLDGVFFAVEVKAPDSPQHKRKTVEASIDHALRKGPTVLQRAFVGHVLDAYGCAGFAATVSHFLDILQHTEDRGLDALLSPCEGHNILEP
jgi:hypothetical protein